MSIFFIILLFVLLILIAILVSINIMAISTYSKKNTYYGGSDLTDHFKIDLMNAAPFICPELMPQISEALANDEIYLTALQRYVSSINPQNTDLDAFIKYIYSKAIEYASPNGSLDNYINGLYFTDNRIYKILNIIIILINEQNSLRTIEEPNRGSLPKLLPGMLNPLKESINNKYFLSNIKQYFIDIMSIIYEGVCSAQRLILKPVIDNLNNPLENERTITSIFDKLSKGDQFIVNFKIYSNFMLPIRIILSSSDENFEKMQNIITVIYNLLASSSADIITRDVVKCFISRSRGYFINDVDSMISKISDNTMNYQTREYNWNSRKGLAVISNALKEDNKKGQPNTNTKWTHTALQKYGRDISQFLGTNGAEPPLTPPPIPPSITP